MASPAFEKLTDLIGSTPLFRLARLSQAYGLPCNLFAKLEMFNPTGSIKDRTALFMLAGAIERGRVKEDTTVIDGAAGNTAISVAAICASLSLKCIIVLPDNAPQSRCSHISAFGASIVKTPAAGGMDAVNERVRELSARHASSFVVSQFEDENACLVHKSTTAVEILSVLPQVDYFVAGAGSCATLTGCGEALKQRCPSCKVIAVEPVDSPILSGGFPGAHQISGIGAGFIPPILNEYIIDEVLKARTPDSIEMMRELARTEGLLCGISSGAALCAAISVASREECRGKNIVVILPDTGERYLHLL